MNNKLSLLQPYPFEKMAQLLAPITPNPYLTSIKLSIGEPQHPIPEFIRAEMVKQIDYMGKYPSTKGLPALRQAITDWLTNRFHLSHVNADHQVIPVSGTREAIFSFTQAVVNTDSKATEEIADKPFVVMPNPFYQIYEGATYLAGGQPYFVNCTADNDYTGDYLQIPESVWQQTQLVFICSPNNPTGAVMPAEKLKQLIALSDQYDFVIASDECYSELYFDIPPVGLLEVCAQLGRHDYKNCVVFHSLSKRSNVPGLRSGFIAGDASLMQNYLKYRTYQGAALPLHTQMASIKAWQDESHVEENREKYRAKFDLWLTELGDKLPLKKPDAGFYFWLPVEKLFGDDLQLTQRLYKDLNITVLAGRFLSRQTVNQTDAGMNHVRLALVADMAQTEQAVARIKKWLSVL